MIERLAAIVIMGLAVWRLASLLARERGPYAIFDRFRHWCGIRYTEIWQGDVKVTTGVETDTELAKLVGCVWCNSVWLGLAASVFYTLVVGFDVWVVMFPFGISTVAILLDQIIKE